MKMNLSSLINLLFLCSCLIIFLLITYCVPNVQGLSQSSLSSFSSFSSSPSPSSFPIFPSSSSSSSSSISNHVHEIATFGDQIASLPCEVNIKSCGSISMVTWFKNVSSQWEHIYSYSFTGGGHHKVSGSFIGQPERISMDDTNITLTGITYLRIKNLGLSDEANYKCEVTYHHSTSTINHHHNNNNMINNNHDNLNGKLLSSSSMPSTDCPTTTYSKLFTLGSTDHLRPPRITEHPSDTVVGRNEPTKLDCRAEGNPNPTIEWYKDGKKIGKHHNRMVLPTGSLFFLHVIHNKKDPDTGTYWCVARNEIGKATSRNATLNYAFLREEFKTLPKSQAIVSGDRVTLDCVPPRGYPEPKVYWAKDGRPVSLPSNRIKLIPGGSLRINDVRPHDAGRYTCIAENLIGTKESPPAILEVSVKPYFIRNPENVSALSGETIEFSCKVGGEPAPYITWTKKDGKIAIGRIQIKDDKTLRIREVKPSDSGVYICEAVNQGGHISSSASLSVDCIPSDFIGKGDQVPTHSPENLRLAVINETSTTLSWSPLSPDQWKGEPKAYFIRLMSTDHRFCSHFNTSSPYQTDLILNNLIYGETYEITVAALTLSGLGSFTEPIPLHMVTSYSYNWRIPNGLSPSSSLSPLSPLNSLSSSSSSSSPSSSLSELLLKDTTILTPSNITKEPIFIFSAILALFVLSFIILILFARRHINWNKGMGAYITVQLNNKCDELSDTKFAKSNGGGGVGPNGGNRGVLAQSTIGNPGYWLSDKKLSTFTSATSSLQQQQQQSTSSSSSTNVQPNQHLSPQPVGQDYSVQTSSDQTINSHQHHHNHHHYNETMDGDESDEDAGVGIDEDDDGCMESDYAEVEERTLRTFGKRDYSSPSTEPYATTTLMKSFRGSSENTSLLGCPPTSNAKSINLMNNKRGTGRVAGGVVNGKKLNLSAVSLNTNGGGSGHRLSSSSSTTRSNNINNGNTSYGKPLTIEGKGHHVPHLRTNHLNSSTNSASSSSSSFNHHHRHLSNSLANQNILNSQSSLPQSTLINGCGSDNLIANSTGKSSSSTFSQQSTNYSNGNLLNASNRLHYQQQQHHIIINNNGSSGSTSDLVNDVNSNHSRSSSLSSSSTINHNNGNRDNLRSDLINKQQQQPSSNVTVHCQYHPIVLASSGSYFEKYL